VVVAVALIAMLDKFVVVRVNDEAASTNVVVASTAGSVKLWRTAHVAGSSP
jgi:hypothetical protein